MTIVTIEVEIPDDSMITKVDLGIHKLGQKTYISVFHPYKEVSTIKK
jgi:hypothetical protein